MPTQRSSSSAHLVLPVWGGGGIEEVGKCAQARPHLPNKDVAILVLQVYARGKKLKGMKDGTCKGDRQETHLDKYSLTDALIVRFISCYGSDAWVHYDNCMRSCMGVRVCTCGWHEIMHGCVCAHVGGMRSCMGVRVCICGWHEIMHGCVCAHVDGMRSCMGMCVCTCGWHEIMHGCVCTCGWQRYDLDIQHSHFHPPLSHQTAIPHTPSPSPAHTDSFYCVRFRPMRFNLHALVPIAS